MGQAVGLLQCAPGHCVQSPPPLGVTIIAQDAKQDLLDALRIECGKPFVGHNKNDVLLNRTGEGT
jgi:hypothetical protein